MLLSEASLRIVYIYIYMYKGSAWVPAGSHAPDRKIFPSAKSRVIRFRQVDIISTPFDLVANGIRTMSSGAGKKRQCLVSVLSSCICLTYRPTSISG